MTTPEDLLALFKRDLIGIDTLNPNHEVCVRCGRVAVGSARINSDRYCHGDFIKPTCYEKESRRVLDV